MRAFHNSLAVTFAGAAALASCLTLSLPAFSNSPAQKPPAPQQEKIRDGSLPCQSFDAPLASPETLHRHRQELLGYTRQMEALKKNGAPAETVGEVAYKRDLLLVENILYRLRGELTSYSGWGDIKAKLKNNGKALYDACIYSLQSTPLPVILQTHPNGMAELDLNTVEQDDTVLSDGHILTQISERPLLEIEDELMPSIANQAVYYMTLYGTTSPDNPVISMSYDLEDLVMMWTVWRAAAAAEQMLHAADYHVRTGDIRSFDSSYNIQPYQHYLVSELSLRAMEHRKNGTNFSAGERKEFKQKTVREALNNPVIRLDGMLGILNEMGKSGDDEKTGFFIHRLSAKEIQNSLHNIDPDVADLNIRSIYTANGIKKNDPARTIKAEILRLKAEKDAGQAPAHTGSELTIK